MREILYATDGSEGALEGARLLASLPLPVGTRIRVLTVTEGEAHSPDADAPFASARDLLVPTGTELVSLLRHGRGSGGTLEQILQAAEEEKTDLMVVGTRGVSDVARLFLGSVAARVARYAPCPVLLARPLRGSHLNRVVVGMDGSAGSDAALTGLLRFPLPAECRIRLVSIVTSVRSAFLLPESVMSPLWGLLAQEKETARTLLAAAKERLCAAGRDVMTEMREDDPATGIIGIAEEGQADLVVVGASGRSGLECFLLGSVTEKVVRHAPCSVLVVR